MASGGEKYMRSGKVRMIVHPSIPTKGRDANKVGQAGVLVVQPHMPA